MCKIIVCLEINRLSTSSPHYSPMQIVHEHPHTPPQHFPSPSLAFPRSYYLELLFFTGVLFVQSYQNLEAVTRFSCSPVYIP